MDKNNDIQVNKVSKWEAAPVSIKNLRNYILETWKNYAAPLCCPPLDPSDQDAICEDMIQLLEPVLDDYNELEARHQKDTGLISEYEEENKKLKGYLDIKKDECDDLISRVIRQDIEYAKLETENDDKDDALKKMIKEIAELEGENKNLKSELDIKKDECDDLISRVFKQDDEYTKLEAEAKKLRENNELCMKAHLRLLDESTKLTTDNKRLSNAVEAWFDMFDDMRHKRDLLKKEYEKLKETNKSCPVACECENFKPKVHHSYDPLDDLPDMEHS